MIATPHFLKLGLWWFSALKLLNALMQHTCSAIHWNETEFYSRWGEGLLTFVTRVPCCWNRSRVCGDVCNVCEGAYLAAGTEAWFVGTCAQAASGSAALSCGSGWACCCSPRGWQTTGSASRGGEKQVSWRPSIRLTPSYVLWRFQIESFHRVSSSFNDSNAR